MRSRHSPASRTHRASCIMWHGRTELRDAWQHTLACERFALCLRTRCPQANTELLCCLFWAWRRSIAPWRGGRHLRHASGQGRDSSSGQDELEAGGPLHRVVCVIEHPCVFAQARYVYVPLTPPPQRFRPARLIRIASHAPRGGPLPGPQRLDKCGMCECVCAWCVVHVETAGYLAERSVGVVCC